MDGLQDILPIGSIHQQADDLRVGQERPAVGMIGAHDHSPGIFDQQVPFQPDGPLQSMHQALVAVLDRRDATAGLQFRIDAEPLGAIDIVQIVTQRAVARHAGRLAKHDLSDVDGDVLVLVHILGQWHRLSN